MYASLISNNYLFVVDIEFPIVASLFETVNFNKKYNEHNYQKQTQFFLIDCASINCEMKWTQNKIKGKGKGKGERKH